ncbi:MAG: TonB family protein [Myxococcales bacterium]|nr:TonB family protein [Myxococcales bacterium]
MAPTASKEVQANREEEPPPPPEEEFEREFDADMAARNAGILGTMEQDGGHFLASPTGGAFAVGNDDEDVWGGLTGTEVGEAYGVGGLGLVGTGQGGGGTGEGTIGLGNTGLIGKGGGGGTGSGYGTGAPMTVVVEAQFTVAEYEIVILSATESNGLDQWLRDNHYNIPAGAEPLLRPYVEQGMKFFVAKVDPAKVSFDSQGRTTLSPLRFHYDSKDFVLPVRLGLINAPDPASGGKQDLIVHILAPNTRYQVANYPNVTIPTNLDVKESVVDHFGDFYVSLFDHTLEQQPKAVVTEYAWGAGACDPCPGPDAALTTKEILELGGDVLPSGKSASSTSPPPIPRVIADGKGAKIAGSLDKDIIRRIIRAHINEQRACYNAGLVRNPKLAGKVTLDFVITEQGTVTTATVAKSTLGDDAVSNCMAKAIQRWKFPHPKGTVTVSYPFDLSPDPTGTWNPGGFRAPMTLANTFVLTRLHARYDSSSLGEDLVFETAEPIIGGREIRSHDGELERGAKPAAEGFYVSNSFQARYAIRHEWPGEIACNNPIRGSWGGPPEGGREKATVARQLARATRGGSLASFITESAGEQLSVAALDSPEPSPASPTKEEEEETAPEKAAPSADAPAGVPAPAEKGGCACTVQPDAPAGALSLTLLGLLGLGLRRRHRDGKHGRR